MSMNVNPNLVKLNVSTLNQQQLTTTTNTGDANPVIISTNESVDPDQMLSLMSSSANLNGITLNTDKQKQAKLDNAKTALANAKEALEKNTDPSKTIELQKAVDTAFENYIKVVQELSNANYFETKTLVEEIPATRAEGAVKVVVEQKLDNLGRVVMETKNFYNENDELVEKQEFIYDYHGDSSNFSSKTMIVYDSNDRILTRNSANYTKNNEMFYYSKTDYYYDKNGKKIGDITYVGDNDTAEPKYKVENGIDVNGNILLTENGCILARTTYLNDSKHSVLIFDNELAEFKVLEEWYEPGSGYESNKWYDAAGKLIQSCIYDENDICTETEYKYDEIGRIVKEHLLEYSHVGNGDENVYKTVNVEYIYNSDGSYAKRSTVFNDKNEIVEETTKFYNSSGKEVSAAQPDKDIPKEVVADILTNLGSIETDWLKTRYSPRQLRAQANKALFEQLEALGNNLVRLGFDSTKIDKAIAEIKSYYDGLFSVIYDDDTKLHKKGETCDTTFMYKDANGIYQRANTNFRHYAFASKGNADAMDERGSESRSGVVLLENTGINHGYKIAIDMKTVFQRLVQIYNAL